MAKLQQLIAIILMFFVGFFTSHLFDGVLATEGQGGIDVASPSDHITEDQIRVYDDKVIINVEGAQWANFADTNSMDPFLDAGSNALQLVPTSPEDIKVGDIITYKYGDERIIHRVVYIGEDEKGIYYIVKGDNNPTSDPGKVRFDQIDRVLFGIIY
ncbi:MAG: signal peptidase I [Nanoarchaeota archaeon]|nr:signal peptidase I [Nanoarchaeota archaeon]